ncbi:MAG: dTMP kinase [Fibrobacterota bacterium]
MKGRLVTFEGIDGCGKTTQLLRLRKILVSRKVRCIVTREPGGTRTAEQIRVIILNPANKALSSRAELLLYLAARAQHVEEIIAPALAAGRTVLSDRFFDATFAYQGGGRSLPMDEIHKMNRFACAGIVPDLTFLFDLPAKAALQRIYKGRGVKDRMEREGARFMEKVRKAYLALAKKEPRRFRVIDASKDVKRVATEVLRQYKEWEKAL